jgi:nitrogen fixation protein NifX
MKIAFTSSDGNKIDCHFGSTESFYVWDVQPGQAKYLEARPAKNSDGVEDKILLRTQALQDCAIVCTSQIGGPAAAKLAARHIHPMKFETVEEVTEVIERLQKVMRRLPPPWLRKAMAKG